MKKRFWACFLSLNLLLTMMPTMAFATDETVDEPADTSEVCTVTDGCTLQTGHEGDCVVTEPEQKEPESVPCTLTQGCTLEADHEGECVTAESMTELPTAAINSTTENDGAGIKQSSNDFQEESKVADDTAEPGQIYYAKWEIDTDTTWYGDGTAQTYHISTAAQLAGLAELVNDGTNFDGKTVELSADINLNNMDWKPIGMDTNSASNRSYQGTAFAGVFDGNGYTISNIKVEEENYDFLGFFGGVDGATIQNLKVESCSISETEGTNFFETEGAGFSRDVNEDAGAFIGYVGTGGVSISNIQIDDITVYGDRVSGSLLGWVAGATQISNVDVTNATILSSYDRAGGLVGYVGGSTAYDVSITDTSVQGAVRQSSVISSPWAAAGLIGQVNLPNSTDKIMVNDVDVFVDVKVSEFYPADASVNGSGAGFIADARKGNITISDSTFSGDIEIRTNLKKSPSLGSASGFVYNSVTYKDSVSILIRNSRSTGKITAQNVYSFGLNETVTAENSEVQSVLTIRREGHSYVVDSREVPIGHAMFFPNKHQYNWTELPTAVREGYVFAWKDSSGTVYTLLKDVVEGDLTIYPSWTANSYTIQFNNNGGEGTLDTITATYDTPLTLPANVFTNSAKNFAGWCTSEPTNPTDIRYSDGAEVLNLTSVNNGTVTLYAYWTDKEVLVLDREVQTKIFDGNVQEFELEGFSKTYEQNGEQIVGPVNVGVYDVIVSASATETTEYFPETMIRNALVITKATPTLTITPSATSLTGGGTVTLTVDKSNLPQNAVVSVSGYSNITDNSNGIYTVTLPNETANYTFTAIYDGDKNHDAADATCTVSVTRHTGGGGASHPEASDDSSSDRNDRDDDDTENIDEEEVPLTEGKVADFDDVPADAWFAEAAQYVYEHDLMTGVSENSFAPNAQMNRAMVAQILFNMEQPTDTEAPAAFRDVAADQWYAKAVNWAVWQGYMSGYGAGSFGPNDALTREQLVTVLWRYSGSPVMDNSSMLNTFSDAALTSDYAQQAMIWAYAQGVISGNADGTLNPQGTATRAEIAQMLMNYCENVK